MMTGILAPEMSSDPLKAAAGGSSQAQQQPRSPAVGLATP